MSELMKFGPYKPPRAFQEIADHIKKAILDRKLKPGAKLPSERELAEQFQVGRLTIREALRSLETSGIITIRKGSRGGAFVRQEFQTAALASIITDNLILEDLNIKEITDARIALECASAEYAAQNATQGDIKVLEDCVRELRTLLSQPKLDEDTVPKMRNFHIMVGKASGNLPLYLFMIAIMEWAPKSRKNLQYWHPTREQLQTALDYFDRILDAIRQKDGQSAQVLVREYIDYIDGILSDSLSSSFQP